MILLENELFPFFDMKISRQVLESIARHARQSRPHECSGILMSTGSDGSPVNCVIPAENAEKENPDKINWSRLSENPAIFTLDFEAMKKNFAPLKKELMEKFWHPNRVEKMIANARVSDDEILNVLEKLV